MEMTKKEFASHFSNSFSAEIKHFGRETLLKEGFDCLIVTDKEDKDTHDQGLQLQNPPQMFPLIRFEFLTK